MKKILSRGLILLFLSIFLFSAVPKTSEAFWPVADWLNTAFHAGNLAEGGVTAGGTTVSAANSTVYNIKEFVGKPLAIFMARQTLQVLTAQTVKWINSGFKGNPAYVTNPGQFFLDMGDRTASAFLSSNSALSQLCSPFQAQVRLALVKSYLNDTQGNYSCTIGKAVQNYNNFVNNFNDGGWEGWASISQNSQNNPYGAYIMAQNQLSISLGNQQNKYTKQLDQGQGFLSFQKCTAWSKPAAPTAKQTTADLQFALDLAKGGGDPSKIAAAQKALDDARGGALCANGERPNSDGICEDTGISADLADNNSYQEDIGDNLPDGRKCTSAETVTPGSVISGQLKKVVGSSVDQLQLVNDINQVVGALVTQLFTQVVGGIGNGLRGASGPDPVTGGTRSILEKMAAGSPESDQAIQSQLNNVNSTLPSNLKSDAKPLYVPPTDDQLDETVKKNSQKYSNMGSNGMPCTATSTDPACSGSTTGNTQYDQCANMVSQQFPGLTQEDLNQRIQSECGTQTQ